MPKPAVDIKAAILVNPPKNGKYYVVAIDGRGGAGKTTLSKYLQNLLPAFKLICGDDYFEPITHPIAWGGYNEERFYNDIIKPIQAVSTEIDYRPYDWDNEPHFKDQIISITEGVFIDRCYSFSFDLDYDFKIWVETPRDLTLNRGVDRSTMPKDKAELVWRQLWKPMEDRYISDIKPLETSDLVIDGNKPFEQQAI